MRCDAENRMINLHQKLIAVGSGVGGAHEIVGEARDLSRKKSIQRFKIHRDGAEAIGADHVEHAVAGELLPGIAS
jgi:hypothetical protein